MKTMTATILALCLCLCVSMASAQEADPMQGDPPSEEVSGLYVFSMGMTREEAKAQGAVPAKDGQMTAKVNWNDDEWNVVLIFKNDKVVVVGLHRALTSNTLVSAFFEEMDSVLCEPGLITMKSGKGKKELNLVKMAAEGKDADARKQIADEALSTFAGQDAGSITLTFISTYAIESMAEQIKSTGEVDDAKIIAEHGDRYLYAMTLDKDKDSITLVVMLMQNMDKL